MITEEEGKPDGRKRRQDARCVDLRSCHFGLVLGGCTTSVELRQPPARRRSAVPASGPRPLHHRHPVWRARRRSNDETLTINITIAGRKTTPSGQKINARVGQKVILNVTSDTDDEIHAHIGGPGYELPAQAGKPATGSFTLDSAGSFEAESHHLEKIIGILNAR
jgi:hypothetical protein